LIPSKLSKQTGHVLYLSKHETTKLSAFCRPLVISSINFFSNISLFSSQIVEKSTTTHSQFLFSLLPLKYNYKVFSDEFFFHNQEITIIYIFFPYQSLSFFLSLLLSLFSFFPFFSFSFFISKSGWMFVCERKLNGGKERYCFFVCVIKERERKKDQKVFLYFYISSNCVWEYDRINNKKNFEEKLYFSTFFNWKISYDVRRENNRIINLLKSVQMLSVS